MAQAALKFFPFVQHMTWPQCALWLAVVCVFGIDLVVPFDLAVGMLYSPIVLATLLQRNSRSTLCIAVASTLLILIGWFLSPLASFDASTSFVWFNRLCSITVVWITAWLVYTRCQAFNQLESARATEHMLRQQLDERHRLLTVASSVGALGGWSFNVKSGILTWSDEVARLHGLKADEPPPALQEALLFYLPADRERVRESLHNAIHHAQAYDYQAQLVSRDGHCHWVRSIGQPVVDESGQVVRIEGSFMDITAWKAAEEARNDSLLRFKQLAESMPLFVWTAQADGTMNYVTQSFFDYIGYPGVLAQHGQWFDMLHPDDRGQCEATWQESIRTGQPYRCEYRIRRHDGVYRWHYAQAVRNFDHVDGTLKWFGSTVDIHERRLISEYAQSLARRLSDMLESITDAFFTLDASWNFTYLNRRAEQVLQRSREELIGANVWVEFAPAVGSLFEREYRRAMAEQCPVVFEQYYAPLGLQFEVHAYPSENGLAVYFQDITERCRAMAQLRLLQAAVTHLNDMVIITKASPQGEQGREIVFVNPAFEHHTGYARHDVLGKTPDFLHGSGTSRAELDRIAQALSRCEPVRSELLNYTKTGESYWVEMELVPLYNDEGEHTHWVAVGRDTTERRQLYERVYSLERMEAIGQLTGGIAHDFNNLLTVIMANTDLLAESVSHDPICDRSLQMIRKAGTMGADLTRRLLSFARRQPLVSEALCINKVIMGIEPLLRRTLTNDTELLLRLAPDLPIVHSDRSCFEDALLNLVINARDALPSAKGQVIIETQKLSINLHNHGSDVDLPAGEYVTIVVSDTGCGIEPKHLPMIFEPFFTTKSNGRGTGLGLPMVMRFFKHAGGHVDVSSQLGHGTRVRLFLPCVHSVQESCMPAALSFPAPG